MNRPELWTSAQRTETGEVTTRPYSYRVTCANGHVWTAETTRWRRRARGGRHGKSVERDCLICKDAAENERRRFRTFERKYS